MKARKILPISLIFVAATLSKAFAPPPLSCNVRKVSHVVCSTREERDFAIAEYLESTNEEALQAILEVRCDWLSCRPSMRMGMSLDLAHCCFIIIFTERH